MTESSRTAHFPELYDGLSLGLHNPIPCFMSGLTIVQKVYGKVHLRQSTQEDQWQECQNLGQDLYPCAGAYA